MMLTPFQFNVVLDEAEVLAPDLREWKSLDAVHGQPPPLCIDIYLDIASLDPKQSLVIHDSDGKRWDVGEALSRLVDSPGRPGASTQIILERWKIYIGDKSSVHPSDLRDPLPNVYKKAVVLFRSLFSYIHFIPTWKYTRNIAKQPASAPSLKLNYRIYNGNSRTPRQDTLGIPLYPSSEDVLDHQDFTPCNSPAGPLCISVQFRNNCEFTVEDSESLLSSHFMGLDDNYLEQSTRSPGPAPGSLPVNKLHPQETPDLGQAYGSMSTFHQVGVPTGTSPMTALRAVRDMPSSSPRESPPQKLPPNHRTAQGSKSSLRSTDAPTHQRRTSVTFQPFKAGSLSSSPAQQPPSAMAASPASLPRPSLFNQPRNRTSLTALPQTALRTPSLPNETAIASSASSSPRPTAPIITRYSSSFGQRRSRFSSGDGRVGSRLDDDNISSGRQSVTSSHQPGSDMLNEGEAASSGSVKTDDENISDFLKLLEQKKDLRSFTKSDVASKGAAARRTTAQLSKYQRLRDSHAALSDSVSSSMLLHRSSTSSSRQLSSVPPMIAGTSVSTSSSPGKPISPHTPHTPAIPSRLSANSIIEYEPRRSRSRPGRAPTESSRNDDAESREPEGQDTTEGTTAIDIPTSPRPWNYARRSSSAAQQNRTSEEEPDIFGLRAASLPTDDVDRERERDIPRGGNLTSSGLFAQTELASAGRGAVPPTENIGPLDSRDDLIPRPLSTSDLPSRRGGGGRGSNRKLSSQHGSSTSLAAATGSSSNEGPRYGSRWAFRNAPLQAQQQQQPDDDEPLLFQMSEIQSGSRRSIEEGRGGGGSGSGSAARRGGMGWSRG